MFGMRWQPLSAAPSDWTRWQSEMDRLFERFAGGMPRRFAQAAYPALNLWEDNDQLSVEAELPGFELDQLEIYVTGGNQLTIRGERLREPTVAGADSLRTERIFGTFNRTFALPAQIHPDDIKARLNDGVLTIEIPNPEDSPPKPIRLKID